MKTTHAGMKISEAEFGALIGDLVKALTSFNAPSREQQELLAVLGPMKRTSSNIRRIGERVLQENAGVR